MESRTVEPKTLDLSEEEGVSDALREAVEEEIDFLEDRDVKLVRMRADDDGDVFQITIHAGDEMYRMSEVAPGHVSRTVFRNPEKDGAMPYQDEVEEEEEDEETEEETGKAEDEEAGAEEGKEEDEKVDASEEDDETKEEPESEEKTEETEETEDEDDGDAKDAEGSGGEEDTGEEDESEEK